MDYKHNKALVPNAKNLRKNLGRASFVVWLSAYLPCQISATEDHRKIHCGFLLCKSKADRRVGRLSALWRTGNGIRCRANCIPWTIRHSCFEDSKQWSDPKLSWGVRIYRSCSKAIPPPLTRSPSLYTREALAQSLTLHPCIIECVGIHEKSHFCLLTKVTFFNDIRFADTFIFPFDFEDSRLLLTMPFAPVTKTVPQRLHAYTGHILRTNLSPRKRRISIWNRGFRWSCSSNPSKILPFVSPHCHYTKYALLLQCIFMWWSAIKL